MYFLFFQITTKYYPPETYRLSTILSIFESIFFYFFRSLPNITLRKPTDYQHFYQRSGSLSVYGPQCIEKPNKNVKPSDTPSSPQYSWWVFPGEFFMILLSSADFFQNQLFRKILLGIWSECQNSFGSRSGPTICLAWSGFKLFAKFICQTTLVLVGKKLMSHISFFPTSRALLITLANTLDQDQDQQCPARTRSTLV